MAPNFCFVLPPAVYSFGVLLWEMVTQEHPWAGDSNVAIIYKVAVHRMHPSIPGAAAGCPAELAELMADCMAYQPQDRPDMQQVLIQLEALLALFAGLQTAA